MKIVSMGTVFFLACAAVAASPAQDRIDALKKHIQGDVMAAPALRKLADERLLGESLNPVFVREARAQNARKVPLARIQELDKEWMTTGSTAALKTSILATAASKELRRIAGEIPAVREAFVMDDQGALVGETNLTSDYWQGDEKKWTDSFNGGQGAAFIDAAQFDASAGAVLQQISLPILDAAGKTVGAVTWGIQLDKVDWQDPSQKP